MLDADARTLHIRCGSDIRDALRTAGFVGDFLEYSDPLCEGPVPDRADLVDVRAGFLAGAYGGFMKLTAADFATRLRQEEVLLRAAHGYERVVLWFEHDSYDQFVLARVLAILGEGPLPACLALICIDRHPSVPHFIGLGQLAPEDLAALWPSRVVVTDAQIALGRAVWAALRQSDPLALGAIAGGLTPALPFAAAAIRRHLQELPWVINGLSLTRRLCLQMLTDGPTTIGRLFAAMMRGVEPLPFLGDIMFLHIVAQMALTRPGVVVIADGKDPFARVVSVTDTGRQVLAGTLDYVSLHPPERWVGGVRVDGGWRWDERGGVVRRP